MEEERREEDAEKCDKEGRDRTRERTEREKRERRERKRKRREGEGERGKGKGKNGGKEKREKKDEEEDEVGRRRIVMREVREREEIEEVLGRGKKWEERKNVGK
ncbi:hypothetical protein, partial [Burkholderia thailandensis]|uniref:hypothetical protein n=1 Tax=Burkholderia thailandensis TaxID=57975 RepID=UPI003F689B24|nr:hypothetical protein [Burkholderia thailandensis]